MDQEVKSKVQILKIESHATAPCFIDELILRTVKVLRGHHPVPLGGVDVEVLLKLLSKELSVEADI